MRSRQSKEIDGYTYNVTQLAATTSLRTFMKLIKIIGPTIAGLIEGAVKEGVDAKEALMGSLDGDDRLTDIMISLFDRVNEQEIIDMIHLFAEHTSITTPEGKEPELRGIFESHFQGRMFSMFKFLTFAIKVNYSDFMRGSSLLKAASSQSMDG